MLFSVQIKVLSTNVLLANRSSALSQGQLRRRLHMFLALATILHLVTWFPALDTGNNTCFPALDIGYTLFRA